MDVLKISMLALLGLCSLTVIRQWKSDFSPLLRLGLTVLFGGIAIGMLSPLIEYLTALMEKEAVLHVTVLFRALGVAFLTQYAAEVCRESGEGGLASHVETVGKIELLLLSIPLMEEILTTADRLLSVGG